MAQEEKNSFLTNSDVLTKYKLAGDIAQRVLKKVVEKSVAGANILEICKFGDEEIAKETSGVYNKKKKGADGKDVAVKKGVAFPTCVSTKSYVCHFSPLPSDPQSSDVLEKGELTRIELGVHIDGYIAQLATTIAVGATKAEPVTGRKADALVAAYTAAEAALRQFKPGRTNWQVTEAISKSAADFECSALEGMSCYQIDRDLLDGEKLIPLNPTEEQRREVETYAFEAGEAYTVDVLMSTGSGKTKQSDVRTTVFRRTQQRYELKMKASRAVFSEIDKKCGHMVFNLRSLDDERKGRMGILECTNHGLVIPYHVMQERQENAEIAHFQFTILITPKGPVKVTSIPYDSSLVNSDKSVKDPELKKLLNEGIKVKAATQ